MVNQACCVYVGSLDFEVTESQLGDHMKSAGDVESVDILVRRDGKSKGCALVEYKTEEAAEKAIDTLNDTEVGKRKIFVREDRGPIEEMDQDAATTRQGKGKGGKGKGKGKGKGFKGRDRIRPLKVGEKDVHRLIYVGNLPWRTAWQDLKDLFRECGDVIRVDMAEGWDGRSKGFATILFQDPEGAQKAIEKYNGYELQGRKLFVREDQFLKEDGTYTRSRRSSSQKEDHPADANVAQKAPQVVAADDRDD
ncbi:splice factor, putative [Perkinsus marinus ATCC 50983]|uniref:Splice factor, putative n=1 Tax=Perkinsus marinus (strain ATCC 50983 / TXsc) TaxID=423536 RepID=C5KBM1_PERM5|nr:splice factor, putative [Perkinsus marinus ATCC 50983]XP_002786345.1 splice factor, putative [Perkinsus marinus ATCC 50983]EER06759.1 splice factor, putative [Perkinsus marinus ATCC 50983]EER18141.1 splice factor, putative [Perkinsus marinus ATCC 50983]|eukprot:XP_002774943.1 splice factor, putative [Perkinsus marinus ATCC 50983]